MSAITKAVPLEALGNQCYDGVASSGASRPIRHVIGVADWCVAARPGDILVTYSLGSCIGLSLYDPVTKIGGLIHCMLPLSKSDAEKAARNPAMYVDTGVVLLIQKMLSLGADKRRLVAKLAGASKVMDKKDMFRIGERNYVVVRKILWKNDILIAGEDVGGSIPRTMTLYLADGRTTIKTGRQEREL